MSSMADEMTVNHYKVIDHGSRCRCALCVFDRQKHLWAKHLPMITADANFTLKDVPVEKLHAAQMTWLQPCQNDTKSSFGCIACASVHSRSTSKRSRGLRTFSCSSKAVLRIGNMKRHQEKEWHQSAVRCYLGVHVGPTMQPVGTAPSTEDFRKVFVHISSGGKPAAGIEGVAGAKKMRCMLWCLAEGMRKLDRHAQKGAVCQSWRRDESRGIVLMRYTSVSKDLKVRSGVFGMIEHVGTKAQDVFKAVKQLAELMATEGTGAPRPARSCKPRHSGSLLQHVLNSVSQIIIDSASYEQKACAMMRDGLELDSKERFCKNLKIITFDMMHRVGRTLPGPWIPERSV